MSAASLYQTSRVTIAQEVYAVLLKSKGACLALLLIFVEFSVQQLHGLLQQYCNISPQKIKKHYYNIV